MKYHYPKPFKLTPKQLADPVYVQAFIDAQYETMKLILDRMYEVEKESRKLQLEVGAWKTMLEGI